MSVVDINNGMQSDSISSLESATFVTAESLSSSNNVSSLPFELMCSDNSVSEPSRADEDEKDYIQKRKEFLLLVANVDQLTNKIEEVKSLVTNKGYDLVMLTEVSPKNSNT